jgi:hypothetical protein
VQPLLWLPCHIHSIATLGIIVGVVALVLGHTLMSRKREGPSVGVSGRFQRHRLSESQEQRLAARVEASWK